MATIVVQDDKILRFLEVILDPDVSTERVDAFRDYLSFDVPDPDAWFDEQRRRAAAIYPSKIRLVPDEAAMREVLPVADAVVSESFAPILNSCRNSGSMPATSIWKPVPPPGCPSKRCAGGSTAPSPNMRSC